MINNKKQPDKPTNFFFLDAESDGLYGQFLSIAVLVTDASNKTIDKFYGAVNPDTITIHSEWVREHVLPHLGNAESYFDSEHDLLESFWDFWMKHKETSYAVGDVISPVEARLFADCVRHNPEERNMLAPFPFLDLSSLLFSVGIDPLASRQELSGSTLNQHDAMNDVKMTSEIWFKYWNNK